jgi:hypothetical protein
MEKTSQSRRAAPDVGESNGGTPRETAPGQGDRGKPGALARFWRWLRPTKAITIPAREPEATRVQLALLRGGRR